MKKHSVKLWTKDLIFAFISNLLMYFSFYLLVPVLPFYVLNDLGATESVAGIVLALFPIASLFVRPFSGYMVDTFSRKPLYIMCYAGFSLFFVSYTLTAALTFFIVMRVLHGLFFGLNSVSGNTIAVDVMHSDRRAEGIGYFGMASNIAMALGPMTGLMLYQQTSFNTLFMISFAASMIGFFAILPIKAPKRVKPEVKEVISLDRFILLKGIPLMVVMALVGIGYGVISSYIGVYSHDVGIGASAGFFFTIEAVGIIGARILGSKIINQGKFSKLIFIGAILVIAGFSCIIFYPSLLTLCVSALLLGLGFGYFLPAVQNMFINLAEHNRRGTANSTYFCSWDMGISVGIFVGGSLIERYGFTWLFASCIIAVVVSMIFFNFIAKPWFNKYRLR